MPELSLELQLHRLVYDDISRYMDARDLPDQARSDRLTPVPFIASMGEATIAFIALFRRTRPNGGVGTTVQYTIKLGPSIIAFLVRNSHDPTYGMLHYRREHLADDLAKLKRSLTGPLEFREMKREEADAFAAEAHGMSKKQIR
ncbi:MAG: hypothetical protein RLN70_02600, partial [Rhodospirillaceae bacterium]